MRLSPHEIADLVIKAGFSTAKRADGDSDAIEFVATILAESGGDTEAMGRSADGANIGNRDHGLAQLSGKFAWDRIIAHGGAWRDPEVNVAIAFEMFVAAGRKFTPWHADTSGAFSTFLPDARIAAAHPWPLKLWPAPLDELAKRMEK